METDLEADPLHYAQMVHRSAERLMRLAHDLLEFSGLEAHRTVLEHGPVEVRGLVEDVAAWAAPLSEGRGLELSVVVDDSVPSSGLGDGRRIAQVVRTLVHNAFKFTERGRVDVRVTSSAADEAATWLEFEVADTGIGIAEEQLPTLFQPFTQADPHASGDRQGNGLGLAIASELAHLMEGRLGVDSVPGEGSTFTFSTPLGRVDLVGSDR